MIAMRLNYSRIGILVLFLAVMVFSPEQDTRASEFKHPNWHKHDPLIRQLSHHYRIDPRLIKSVIWTESNFDKNAVSHAGAQGLMQLMPETAAELGVRHPFNPRENIDGGIRYLRALLIKFGSLKKALFAYNAGGSRVTSGTEIGRAHV